jgi:predicted negative regulator of RcsB-dependent stress response
MSEDETKPQDDSLMPQNGTDSEQTEKTDGVSQELPASNDGNLDSSSEREITADSSPAPLSQNNHNNSISKKLRYMQLSLAACITLTAIVVCFRFFGPARTYHIITTQTSDNQVKTIRQRKTNTEKTLSELKSSDTDAASEPASLYTANLYYKQGNYKKALEVFKKLRNGLALTDNEPFRDYLLLCMAICDLKTGNNEQAVNNLKIVSESDFNFVRLCANYYLCQIELSNKQLDSANIRAYRVLALIESAAPDKKLALIRNDCEYYAAVALTRILTGLSDTDRDVPQDLYQKNSANYDAILDTDEIKLKQAFAGQQNKFQDGILSPLIQRCEPAQNSAGSEQTPLNLSNCSVITWTSSIEELLSRFAANYSLELNWNINNDLQAIRQRPVRLYMTQCPAEQFIQVAAGSAGLAAEVNDNIIKIYNPSDYTLLSEHIDLLYNQAVSLWHKFMLSHFEDTRISYAHFALAALYTSKNNIPQAIDEFKLISSKYSQSKVAPYALLRSARLKIAIKDFVGARRDLTELVEQYPDCLLADRAYLVLADITSIQGDKLQAGKLFTKVYNLNYSAESQKAAAINAAQAFYEGGDYESAVQWAAKCINLAKTGNKNSLYSAYLLIGKTYIAWDKFDKGCSALKFALAGQLTKEEYKDTVFSLLDGYIKKQNFVDALDLLGNIDSWQFSEHEYMQLLILKSRVYRNMSLYSKAISTLADKAEYIADKQLKSQMLYEIALAKIEMGNLNSAYNTLMETIRVCEPGAFNDQITITLAEICLKLNRDEQVSNLCSELIRNSSSQQIKQQARLLVADVYRRQNNFDKAALALLGVPEKTE